MDKTEEVKRILAPIIRKKVLADIHNLNDFNPRFEKKCAELALQICQLFPKSLDNPGGYEPKPDSSRLLTDEEIYREVTYGFAQDVEVDNLTDEIELRRHNSVKQAAKAQDAKTLKAVGKWIYPEPLEEKEGTITRWDLTLTGAQIVALKRGKMPDNTKEGIDG